jgi:hypothetical protein
MNNPALLHAKNSGSCPAAAAAGKREREIPFNENPA